MTKLVTWYLHRPQKADKTSQQQLQELPGTSVSAAESRGEFTVASEKLRTGQLHTTYQQVFTGKTMQFENSSRNWEGFAHSNSRTQGYLVNSKLESSLVPGLEKYGISKLGCQGSFLEQDPTMRSRVKLETDNDDEEERKKKVQIKVGVFVFKFGNLKQYKFIFSQFCMSEVWVSLADFSVLSLIKQKPRGQLSGLLLGDSRRSPLQSFRLMAELCISLSCLS